MSVKGTFAGRGGRARLFMWGNLALCTGMTTMACGHSADTQHPHAHPGPEEMKHHHAHHRFEDAEKWAQRFEDPQRDAWQKPDDVLTWLELEGATQIADIGAATGYFPVRIAKRWPQAQVWGVDIETSMVRYLDERAEKEGLPNLHSVLGSAEMPNLPEPVDVVLMVNTYHHIENRSAYFRHVATRLRESGRIAILDFLPGDLPLGPPASMKIPPAQVESEMAAAGCRLERQNDTMLPYQFIQVFRCGG